MIPYTTVPASQIMPVSGYELPTELNKIQTEALDFFFKKGPLAYKLYKNAYAISFTTSNDPNTFLANFFNVFEESLRLQLKNEGNDTPEKQLAIKNGFEIISKTLQLLSNSGIKINIETLYASFIAFILGKLK